MAQQKAYQLGNEQLAQAIFDDECITMCNIRDSVWSGDDPTMTWIDDSFDPRELTNLWVYFSYFSKIRGLAHTELGFEFSDGRVLVGSFEIRPFKGERYSPIAGLGKNFQLNLRWATERDILSRRFFREDEANTETYMFEADITHQRMVELFRSMAKRTNELHEGFEWYNTLTNTCTTAMLRTVDEVLPGHFRFTVRNLLPGWLPKYWATRGVLKFDGDFDTAFEAAHIGRRCVEIGDCPDFSTKLRARSQLPAPSAR